MMAYPSLIWTPAGGSAHQLKRYRTGAMKLRIIEGRYGPGEMRGGDRTIPSRRGQRRRNRVFHEQAIVLTGSIAGIGATLEMRRQTFHTLMTELETMFDPELGEGVLADTLPDGTVRTATLQVESIQFDDPTLDFFMNIPSIELSSVDVPVWTNV